MTDGELVGQQGRQLVHLVSTLDSDSLTPEMNNRLALVRPVFLICLLKRLRDDVLHMGMHECLKLMQSVPEQPSHAVIVVAGPTRTRLNLTSGQVIASKGAQVGSMLISTNAQNPFMGTFLG